MVRGNKQIWRIAEYLYVEVFPPWETIDYMSWTETAQSYKDQMYDKALKLIRKVTNNEFTGVDNHEG